MKPQSPEEKTLKDNTQEEEKYGEEFFNRIETGCCEDFILTV